MRLCARCSGSWGWPALKVARNTQNACRRRYHHPTLIRPTAPPDRPGLMPSLNCFKDLKHLQQHLIPSNNPRGFGCTRRVCSGVIYRSISELRSLFVRLINIRNSPEQLCFFLHPSLTCWSRIASLTASHPLRSHPIVQDHLGCLRLLLA